jgi:phosphoenolpyruvate carboxylase
MSSLSVNQDYKPKISSSVRALYRIIGKIIGRQIFDRLSSDKNISEDKEYLRTIAQEVIQSITKFRRELLGTRDFNNVEKIINDFFQKDHSVAVKQLAWILEAYLLLNQSSTASAEVTKPTASMTDRLLMSKLIDLIRTKVLQEKDLAKVFTQDFSMNLVLTAHPTAGIQPDYINHIKHMVDAVQKISYRIAPSEWDKITQEGSSEVLESAIADIVEDITRSVSHMVRTKPYNEKVLTPSDESRNFLVNINEAWNIIPLKVIALEQELRKYLGPEFRIHGRFFRLHTWVARDVDGNPTVSKEEHLKSVIQERLHFLSKYRQDLDKLWQSLSDDFTNNPELPSKTYFVNKEFQDYYKVCLDQLPDYPQPYQAYRVVLQLALIKLDNALDAIVQAYDQASLSRAIALYNLEEDLIKPLELIRANKEGVNSQEIDMLIRKAQVFGDFGSHGHTRQGADTLSKLCRYLTALWDDNISAKTEYIFRNHLQTKMPIDPKLSKLLKVKGFDYNSLRVKMTLQYSNESEKTQQKLNQSFDLLELSELGSIRRQIISMNINFEHMLNVLVLAKCFGAFKPAEDGYLPYSRLEIVPLTEQISDLRNSYQVTIDALTNRAWNQYLIANKGRFYKMRGPSDSGKQNGFVASQWEMFKSKQLDTIVVEIFNAFLFKHLFDHSEHLDKWLELVDESTLAPESDGQVTEAYVIQLTFKKFTSFFASEDFEKDLWLRAQKELGLEKVRLINFDGWGEPVERGGGLEFEDTVKCTQPIGSLPYYERTLQGGGAQQLASDLRTRQAVQDFMNGVSEIAVRRFALDRVYNPRDLLLDPNFVELMNRMVKSLRSSLRGEVLGLDLEDDTKVSDEIVLRNYFRHVIKSPLIYLDLFNIASRPTSRSGSQIKEYLNSAEYNNSIDKLADNLGSAEIVKILGDVRAIPYAAMFTLVGGNHVSFYGYEKILSSTDKFGSGTGVPKKTILEWLGYFYKQDLSTQESRLVHHIIGSLERGIISADQDCYRKAHTIIESATNPDYNSSNDLLILKLVAAQQNTLNFIAQVKNYSVNNPKKVLITEIMQDDIKTRDLLIARRNDAAVPRLGIAVAMAQILQHAKSNNLNPLDEANIPTNLMDLLRKAFAAGASTFGNGCID